MLLFAVCLVQVVPAEGVWRLGRLEELEDLIDPLIVACRVRLLTGRVGLMIRCGL
jgi:hypothetical protein